MNLRSHLIWLSINRLQWQQFECVVIGIAICYDEKKKKRKERRNRHSIRWSLGKKVVSRWEKSNGFPTQSVRMMMIRQTSWLLWEMETARELLKNSIIFRVWHDSIFVSFCWDLKPIQDELMRDIISALNDKCFNFLLETSFRNIWRLQMNRNKPLYWALLRECLLIFKFSKSDVVHFSSKQTQKLKCDVFCALNLFWEPDIPFDVGCVTRLSFRIIFFNSVIFLFRNRIAERRKTKYGILGFSNPSIWNLNSLNLVRLSYYPLYAQYRSTYNYHSKLC